MFVLGIINTKGGSGKTTVALGLAVAAAKIGEAVVVIDIDPQTSATNWKDLRDEENPVVISIQVGRLRQTLETARQHGSDLVIIDTPGTAESAGTEAARYCDFVLVPSKSGFHDMKTLPTVRSLINAGGNPPAVVVYNAIHPSGIRIAEQLIALTADHCGLPACPVYLTNLAAHEEAAIQGKAPGELEPSGRAAGELEQLYLYVNAQRKKNGEGRIKAGRSTQAKTA